jgi:hypothetical protein
MSDCLSCPSLGQAALLADVLPHFNYQINLIIVLKYGCNMDVIIDYGLDSSIRRTSPFHFTFGIPQHLQHLFISIY